MCKVSAKGERRQKDLVGRAYDPVGLWLLITQQLLMINTGRSVKHAMHAVSVTSVD